jgi:FHA domain
MRAVTGGPASPDDLAELRWPGEDRERTQVLDPGSSPVVTIGRSSGATIRLADDQVSRSHAEVAWDGRDWVVRDAGSRNGTFVRGAAVSAGVALRHGDVLRCGRTSLAFVWPAAAHGGRTSQAATVARPAPPPLGAGEVELLRELCRPFPPGEDPRHAATAPPTNAELADRLHITEDGVRQRLKRLYPKFGLAGRDRAKRRELAARAIEAGVAHGSA